MDKQILLEAQKVILENKLNAERIAEKNLNKALKNKEFAKLYSEEKQEIINQAKNEAYGKQINQNKIDQIIIEKNKILKKLKISTQDFMPNYTCKTCSDTGFVKGALCECLKNEINKILIKNLNRLSPLKSFADDKVGHPSYEAMKKWCNLNNNYLNVLICGPTGTGKTFLSECVATELIKQNQVVSLTSAINLNNNFLSSHIAPLEQKLDILNNFLDADVLIIDDLGTEPIYNNVTQEYLYLIISERMNMGKRTVITTNLDLKNICDRYGERIASRLLSKIYGLKIKIDQDDLRLKIKK